MTIFVLGGGPTGMALVDGLVDAGEADFKLIEATSVLGGLAQTRHWIGAGYHDLGPHKIFSTDLELVERVEKLLPQEDWLTRKKISSIYMNGHFLSYPPSPFSLARVFGFAVFLRMVFSYGIARMASLNNTNEPETFEDDLVHRVGADLYNILFKPIALKLWGDPKYLDVKLSRGRVQTPKLIEILTRMIGSGKKSGFEALEFRYPKKGLGSIWKAIEEKAKGKGEFFLEHLITGLEESNGRISRIVCVSKGQTISYNLSPEDFVVSTLPLSLTTKLLSNSLTENILKIAENVVTLNDLTLVFLHLDVSSLIDESWVFIPDPNIIFHRLSEQESFDPSMTPGGSIVCCEIMNNPSRNLDDVDEKKLVSEVLNGLHRMGYRGFKVLQQCVIRLPNSYPVFKPGYENGLKEVLTQLDAIQNFRTVGRQGAFNYIGTLDAMDIGYGFVRWYLNSNKQSWASERSRTNHYPVLD